MLGRDGIMPSLLPCPYSPAVTPPSAEYTILMCLAETGSCEQLRTQSQQRRLENSMSHGNIMLDQPYGYPALVLLQR